MRIKITILIIILHLYSCADYRANKNYPENSREYYSSSGFALVYQEHLYNEGIINKKITNEGLLVMHNTLRKNTPVKIINPDNNKIVETKIYKKADYPAIFNMVINRETALILGIDFFNPFLEIIEIKKNKKFIAKEGSMFEEEKSVANKAPVDEIQMNDLSINTEKKEKEKKKKGNFILVISDFYYLDSANTLKNDLIKKIDSDKILVKKINNNKYRLLIGPFKNFNALKTTYISLNKLGFESLNIYRE